MNVIPIAVCHHPWDLAKKKKKNTHTHESLKSSPLVGGSTQKPETEPGWNLAQIFWGRAP